MTVKKEVKCLKEWLEAELNVFESDFKITIKKAEAILKFVKEVESAYAYEYHWDMGGFSEAEIDYEGTDDDEAIYDHIIYIKVKYGSEDMGSGSSCTNYATEKLDFKKMELVKQ